MTPRIGLIARADDTGLGTQAWEFYRAFKEDIAKVLIVDICHLSPKKLVLHPERYIRGMKTIITHDVEPDVMCLEQFLDGVDIVYTAETPYNYALFTLAEERGIKTVLHVNAEFNDYVLQPNLPRPSLFAAPTTWMYESIPEPKCLLPVPVALDRFEEAKGPTMQPIPSIPRPLATNSFLHLIGHPAAHDRAGTKDLLAALPYVTQHCNLTIKCQDAGYLKQLGLDRSQNVGNVSVVVDTSSPDNYWDLYTDAEGSPYDVMVLPRRFGGLCLPMQEALAAGMPVIMPNISPNSTELPADWLVPASRYGRFMAKQFVDLHRTRRRDLAARIDDFCGQELPHSFLHYQKAKARSLAEVNSWERLRPKYVEVFEQLTTEKKERVT